MKYSNIAKNQFLLFHLAKRELQVNQLQNIFASEALVVVTQNIAPV